MPGWEHEDAADFDGCDIYLNCIAKIIPPAFIEGRTILNAHPGLLPQNRGVDAFKWAVVKGRALGVTLHAIDEEIDRGEILTTMRVPVLAADTLADVCQRMYDTEIYLLSHFDLWLNGERTPVGDDYPCSHSLIPLEQDQRLEQIFEENRSALMAA